MTHNCILVGEPIELHLLALGVSEPGVVGGGLHARAPQLLRHRVAVDAGETVHYARLPNSNGKILFSFTFFFRINGGRAERHPFSYAPPNI